MRHESKVLSLVVTLRMSLRQQQNHISSKIKSDELILHPDITFSPKVVNSLLEDEAQHIKDMVRKDLLPLQDACTSNSSYQ